MSVEPREIGEAARSCLFPPNCAKFIFEQGQVDVELLRQLSQRPIALDGGKRHLRLEGRCVVPARSSLHGLS
jgi:hypothetical protein